MNYNTTTNSLLTLSSDFIIANLKYYVENGYGDLLNSLPYLLKNRLLKRFTSSSHFWKDLDPVNILKLLINSTIDCIDLTLFDVDDKILESLKSCKNLKKLYLCKTRECLTTASGLMNFIPNVPNLNILILSNCDGVTDSVVEHLVHNCPHLCGIDIAGNQNITDKSLEVLAKLNNLLYITLSRTNVTNNGIQALLKSKNGPKLQELLLGECYHLTDDILTDIADVCADLQILVFHKQIQSGNDQTIFAFDALKGLKQLVYTIQW